MHIGGIPYNWNCHLVSTIVPSNKTRIISRPSWMVWTEDPFPSKWGHRRSIAHTTVKGLRCMVTSTFLHHRRKEISTKSVALFQFIVFVIALSRSTVTSGNIWNSFISLTGLGQDARRDRFLLQCFRFCCFLLDQLSKTYKFMFLVLFVACRCYLYVTWGKSRKLIMEL